MPAHTLPAVGAVDLWINLLTSEMLEQFTRQSANAGVSSFFGSDLSEATSADALVATMDSCDVEIGVLTAGLSGDHAEQMLAVADSYPGRFAVAGTVDKPSRVVHMMQRVRELAARERFAMVRITPMVDQIPLNDRRYYPVYATCAELGVPVSINVGIPGPRVRSACQDPLLLEDVLIDFPGLVVIGAHMGHPYESLLITYMLKWPNLYLSNSAYLATYMDDALVSFMASKRGVGRVLFASDHPFLPVDRAVAAARKVPLPDDALQAYLGGTARRLLGLAPPA